MLGRSLLLILTMLVAAGVVMRALRNPRVGALFHQGIPDRPKRRLFLGRLDFCDVLGGAYACLCKLPPDWPISRHLHWRAAYPSSSLGDSHSACGGLWMAVEFGCGSEQSSIIASRLMSFLYGAGAALTLDEFALWLNLEDVYRGPARSRKHRRDHAVWLVVADCDLGKRIFRSSRRRVAFGETLESVMGEVRY
jgi:hypothetical protein